MKFVKYSNNDPSNPYAIDVEWRMIPQQIEPKPDAGYWSQSYIGRYESWYWDQCGHLAFDKIACPCGKKHEDRNNET